MHELIVENGFGLITLFVLLSAAFLVGAASGGVPGTASLAAPLAALVVPSLASAQVFVIPLLVVAQAFVLISELWRKITWREVLPMLLPTAIGAVLGTAMWAFVLKSHPSWQIALKCICGAVVLFAAFAMARDGIFNRGRLFEMTERRRNTLATIGSFFSTAVNSAGPIFAWCFQTRGLDKHALTATVAAIFLWMNVLKIPQYLIAGLWNKQTLITNSSDGFWMLFFIACLFPGIFIGRRIRHMRNDKWFIGGIVSLSLIVGLLVLFKGASEFFYPF